MDSEPSRRIRIVATNPDWLLVDRYFSGECTPEEVQAIETWAAQPSNAHLLASMRQIWAESATPVPAFDDLTAWRALQQRIVAADTLRIRERAGAESNHRPFWWRATTIAAALTAVAVGSAFWWRLKADATRMASASEMNEYVTARGQVSKMTLTDGTSIWLDVDSRLLVPKNYGTGARDLTLVGDAYFVVTHDARRPFRVHTSLGVTEDVGTAFRVRAYPTDTVTVVSVASGRVTVKARDAANGRLYDTQLGAGQMGRLDRRGGVQVTSHVDVDESLRWLAGQLTYHEQPLRDVVPDIERWCDIDLTVDDSALLNVPVTVTLTSQSTDDVLTILAGTLGAHYTRQGRTVHIR